MPVKSIVSALLLLSAVPTASAGQTSPNPKEQISQDEQKAQQYLREKRPDLAITELKKIVSLDPNNLEDRANLGVLLYFRGDYQDALPELRAAIDAKPDLWKIRSLLGLTEEKTSDFDGARKDLESSFPMIEEKKLKIEVGLDLIGLYTRNQDLDKAANLASQLKIAFPDEPEVLYAAYRTFADLSGEAKLDLALVAPDSAQMHQLLAHEESREGNTNAAIVHYKQAITIDPHLPGVHFELAELLRTSADPVIEKQAEQEYRAAIAENPEDEKAISKLGEIADQKGDVKQAYSYYTKAVQLQPSDADAKLGLAKALLEMDQPDRALPLLEASVGLDPTNSSAHYRLATLYKKMGRGEDARREVELYKKYKDMKEKLRVIYKDVLIQPQEIREDDAKDK